RIETKRAIVVTRLHQTDPYGSLSRCPIEYGTHQASADSVILHIWSDGNRTDSNNRRAFVHEAAANNFPGLFGDHAVESWVADQHRRETRRDFGRGKVWRKIVLFREICKCVIQDTTTHLCIGFVRVANVHNQILCVAKGLINSSTRRRPFRCGFWSSLLHPSRRSRPKQARATSVSEAATGRFRTANPTP